MCHYAPCYSGQCTLWAGVDCEGVDEPPGCPLCRGPFGSWRSVVAGITAILADPTYGEAQAVIDGIWRIRDARLQPYARETALQKAVDALEYDRQVHYHDRCGNLLRAAGWAQARGRCGAGGADYLGGGERKRRG